MTRNTDKIITFIVKPFLTKKTRRLVERRQGFIKHLKLNKVFKAIDEDLWVKKSREQYLNK